MARRSKKQQQSSRKSLIDCEIRPVVKSDKWCRRKNPKGQIPDGDVPWGYVVTIPYCPKRNTLLDNVDGYIVRTKMHCGKLLLQVIKKDYAPEYGVKSTARAEPNANKRKRKKLCRIVGIKNLNKSKGKWGK